jgi:hypothetical protein
MYLSDMLCLIAVCPNYFLFPLLHSSPSAAILLVAISIDVILQQVWIKGQQVKYRK